MIIKQPKPKEKKNFQMNWKLVLQMKDFMNAGLVVEGNLIKRHLKSMKRFVKKYFKTKDNNLIHKSIEKMKRQKMCKLTRIPNKNTLNVVLKKQNQQKNQRKSGKRKVKHLGR